MKTLFEPDVNLNLKTLTPDAIIKCLYKLLLDS